MIAEQRTIARIIDLFHLPLQHTPEVLRGIYAAVSGSCGYDNFIRTPGGARLESAPGEGSGISRAAFSRDRITFHEEQGQLSLENLLRRVEEVLKVATESLSIPILICRNITLRVAAPVTHAQSSAEFLAEHLFRLEPSDLQPFGRPGQIIGMRMHFPGLGPKGGTHQLRIESYLRDPGSLFIEDLATFKLPVQSRDRESLARELREVDEFVQQRVHRFLAALPRP